MLDRGRALQILGLDEGADESEAAVAYRELRRHVEARERSAADTAERELRIDELRDLERAWRAMSSLPTPTGIIQPTRPPRTFRLAPRWLLAWALVATAAVAALGLVLVTGERNFGPLVLMDGVAGGEGGGGDGGFAIDGAGEEETDEEEGGGSTQALDAGPRAELTAESDVEGAQLSVSTRGETPEVVAQGAADETSYWLAPGAYTVEVRHPDCRDAWSQEVDVAPDATRVRLDPEICRRTGWVVVRSNVADDELTIDGEKLGSTGEDKHPVPTGEHEVRVAKRGYQSWEGIVEVEAGRVLGIRPRLEAVRKTAKKKSRPKQSQAAPTQVARANPSQDRDGEAEKGRSERWHEDARRWLLARYDFDRSGALDSREEIESVPCDHWLGLEQSHDESNLGLSLTRFYGFDGSGWRSGALGVGDEARDLAYGRMQACGLR